MALDPDRKPAADQLPEEPAPRTPSTGSMADAFLDQERELAWAWWGFLLLAVALLLRLCVGLFDANRAGPYFRLGAETGELLTAWAILLALLPASRLLVRSHRSRVWRDAANCLGWAGLGQLGIVLFMAGWRLQDPGPPVDQLPDGPEQAVAELGVLAVALLALSRLADWLVLWWTAVVVGEFARACQALQLAAASRWLGRLVWGGIAVWVVCTTWFWPPVPVVIWLPTLDTLLRLVDLLYQVVVTVAAIFALSAAAALARVLARRSRRLGGLRAG